MRALLTNAELLALGRLRGAEEAAIVALSAGDFRYQNPDGDAGDPDVFATSEEALGRLRERVRELLEELQGEGFI